MTRGCHTRQWFFGAETAGNQRLDGETPQNTAEHGQSTRCECTLRRSRHLLSRPGIQRFAAALYSALSNAQHQNIGARRNVSEDQT
jgi:hypothetical protein